MVGMTTTSSLGPNTTATPAAGTSPRRVQVMLMDGLRTEGVATPDWTLLAYHGWHNNQRVGLTTDRFILIADLGPAN